MILFLVAVFLTVSFIALYIKYEPKPDFSERIIILISAFVAILLDFAVEYLGTTAGSWNYPASTSLFKELLFGHIPLELPIIFASFGANVAIIALQNRQKVTLTEINKHMSRKTLLAFFSVFIGVIWYFSRFLGVNALIIAIPMCLLGLSLVPLTREVGLYGIIIFLLDLIIEAYVVLIGYYSYDIVGHLVPRLFGLPLIVPLEYGLFTVGGILIISYVAAWYEKWRQVPNWYKQFFSKRITVY